MRIACLQFAPQVGDVENNLNRADAVLAKADQDDIDSLDLLVLPELAFSGYNFQSWDDVSSCLEPSGSGITSLWARTVALKHNTNVVVGYPEKADVSGRLRDSPDHSGPGYYNSAILVNSDGETVANYRKTFLYPVDETWAHEGKGFYGGRVPGLGNTAIGICTDINPHRLQAPWHAFEFAFHVLDVRANLVIVSMAWVTGEDRELFTQSPNEPDMEALTYWAQRLEPVIRDESRDEIVFVFCNRTGIEGNAVYSGTSAVMGIYQGEVKVYGVLGRGVKELLVVDTDEAPFANLVVRKEKTRFTSHQRGQKPSGPQESDADVVSSNPSLLGSLETSPTKRFVDGQNQEARQVNTLPSRFKEPVPESLDPPTLDLTRSSPSGSSKGTATENQGGRNRDSAPSTNSASPNHRILGGSVTVALVEDRGLKPDDAECPKLSDYSASHPGPPPDRPLPELPQSSGVASKPITVDKYQTMGAVSNEYGQLPRQSAMSEMPSGSRELPNIGYAGTGHTRPNTATGVPSRQGSTKTQAANTCEKCSQHQGGAKQARHKAAERFEVLPPSRSQSAMAQRSTSDQKESRIQKRPRSPKSRNASRSGRRFAFDHVLPELALDLYLKSIIADARNGDHDTAHTVSSSDTAARSQYDHSERPSSPEGSSVPSDRGQAPSQTTTASGHARTSSTHKDPQASRTVLWEKMSNIVDEHLRCAEAQEEARGRRRSRSASSTEARRGSAATPPARGPALLQSNRQCESASIHSHNNSSGRAMQGSRGTSSSDRRTPSQTKQGAAGGIRSVRDPSLGPPSDPEDEIVAEIVFRRPHCASCGSRVDRVEDRSAWSNALANPDAASDSRSELQTLSGEQVDRNPSNNRFADAMQDLSLLPLQTSTATLSKSRVPSLSRASMRTPSSYEPSPITPPPREFDPRAPRPMVLNIDDGTVQPDALDPVSKLSLGTMGGKTMIRI